MEYLWLIFILVGIVLAAVIVGIFIGNSGGNSGLSGGWLAALNERQIRSAGSSGEQAAVRVIRELLREGDYLLTNLEISYEGKPAELDVVVVNTCGVFVIEIKNYNGALVGTEDDYEWKKYHTTAAGNTYEKTVKNPIRQVNRQVYLLAYYLRWAGIDVWVSGFALLLQCNSPVESPSILNSRAEIDRAIHTPGRKRLTRETVEKIVNILQ